MDDRGEDSVRQTLRGLPFHAHVIKYDPAFSLAGYYDDGSWTSVSDIGSSFGGVVLTAERYASVEAAHLDVLATMAEESGVEKLRRIDQQTLRPLDESLEEVRAALREDSDAWLWLNDEQPFYIAVSFDYHLYCGSHRPCDKGLAIARSRGLHPRLEGPGPDLNHD